MTPEAHIGDERPARPPLIGPGHTLGSITDKISSIVIGGRTPLPGFGEVAVTASPATWASKAVRSHPGHDGTGAVGSAA